MKTWENIYYARDFPNVKNRFPEEFQDKIICADSQEYLQNIPDNCIDFILTSPPYNFGKRYDEYDDNNNWPEYFDKLEKVLDECVRVLKYGGRIAINIQPKYSDYVPIHHIISTMMMAKGLILKVEILWEKNHYNCPTSAWGSWKSPSCPYFKQTWEFIEVFCKGSLKHDGDSKNADIMGTDFRKWVYAKWSVAPETQMLKKYNHPAMFPKEIAKRCIQIFSFKGDVVLDPFAGAGTTCVVAHDLERKYLGIDISRDYCDVAESRILHEVPVKIF